MIKSCVKFYKPMLVAFSQGLGIGAGGAVINYYINNPAKNTPHQDLPDEKKTEHKNVSSSTGFKPK